AAFEQLEIVVAEPPELPLAPLQHPAVIIVLEPCGRFPDERRKVEQHRAIDRRADRSARLGSGQYKTRRVQQFDGEAASHSHLTGVERRIGARAAAGGPITYAVRTVFLEQPD